MREGTFEPVARHLEHVHARTPLRGFQQGAGSSVQVDDVAALVEHDAGRTVAGKQQPFDQARDPGLPIGPRGQRDSGNARMGRTRDLRKCRQRGRLAPKEFQAFVDGFEGSIGSPQRLRGAQHQQPAGLECVREGGEQLLLQVHVHVDQHIAAGDHIQARERRIANQTLRCEHRHATHVLADSVTAILRGEVTRQASGGHGFGDGVRVAAAAGALDGLRVQIGAEDLYPESPIVLLHEFEQGDGQAVHLLAARASGNPDAQHAVLRQTGEIGRQPAPDQGVERLGVAKEPRDVDQQLVEQGVQRGRGFLQEAQILRRLLQLMDLHLALDAAAHRVQLVGGKVVPGVRLQEDKDLRQ